MAACNRHACNAVRETQPHSSHLTPQLMLTTTVFLQPNWQPASKKQRGANLWIALLQAPVDGCRHGGVRGPVRSFKRGSVVASCSFHRLLAQLLERAGSFSCGVWHCSLDLSAHAPVSMQLHLLQVLSHGCIYGLDDRPRKCIRL